MQTAEMMLTGSLQSEETGEPRQHNYTMSWVKLNIVDAQATRVLVTTQRQCISVDQNMLLQLNRARFAERQKKDHKKKATRPSAQHATTETAVTQSILVRSKKLAIGGDSFDQGYKDLQ